MLDATRAFTHARQRLGRAAPDAAGALHDVVAVYSSHPSAPLALHARSSRMAADDFRAVAGEALRVPAMRGSIHLMPAAAARRAFRALGEPAAARAARLRGFGISEERYAGLRSLLLDAAVEPRSQKELVAALGLPADEVKGATAVMTREGSLVRVGAAGLRSNALRYVAQEIPQHDRDAALAWLTGEYLRTLGPARPEDLAWWLGVPRGRADAALAEHAVVDVGDDMLLRAEDERAFAEAPAPIGVDLLGKWDPLTMGHAPDGRARCGMDARCYDFRGDGLPVVLVDGVAAATWSMTAKGRRLAFSLEPFEAPGARLRGVIELRAEEVAALLA
ncbi:MAG: winged helix DNA-binding domain-containing protein [Actinomycetota bacterium]|nr:winged helix DNA-binding domain-containing protein [Actinomycetota bacterium]